MLKAKRTSSTKRIASRSTILQAEATAKKRSARSIDCVNAADYLENSLSNLEGLVSALAAGADHSEFIEFPKVMNLARELINEAQQARLDLVGIVEQHLAEMRPSNG